MIKTVLFEEELLPRWAQLPERMTMTAHFRSERRWRAARCAVGRLLSRKGQCGARMAVLLGAGLLAAAGGRCQTADPVFVNRAFVGEDFFVGFFPSTGAWLSLQRSADGVTWTNVASIATTNTVTEFVDSGARISPRGFYRLRRPGVAVELAEAKWSPHSGSDYRFQLRHVRLPERPNVLSATVTLSGGEKAIADAEGDGQSLGQAEAGDFPSVEELLAALKQAQQSGCWRVAVSYDPILGYPVWCVIEQVRDGLAAKQVHTYWITGLSLTRDEGWPLTSQSAARKNAATPAASNLPGDEAPDPPTTAPQPANRTSP